MHDVIKISVDVNIDKRRKYVAELCEDFAEYMENDPSKKEFVKWSLENVTEILYHKFPESDVLVVQPSRYDHNVFSCYDNFVPSGKYGIPSFVSDGHPALSHLLHMLENLSNSVKSNDENVDFTKFELSLIGFSKGCVVLNQVLHEFHFIENLNYKLPTSRIISQVCNMYFLDGGHAGKKNTWITGKSLLETLSKLGINVFIHVTPYQIYDKLRPWIGKEEGEFFKCLKNFSAPITRKVHFERDVPCLEKHFQVLEQL